MKIWLRTRKIPKNNPTASNMSTTIRCRMPHPGQIEILSLQSIGVREALGQIGIGKNRHPKAAHLEHKRCWWIAPTYQMASQIWRDLVNSVKHLEVSH